MKISVLAFIALRFTTAVLVVVMTVVVDIAMIVTLAKPVRRTNNV